MTEAILEIKYYYLLKEKYIKKVLYIEEEDSLFEKICEHSQICKSGYFIDYNENLIKNVIKLNNSNLAKNYYDDVLEISSIKIKESKLLTSKIKGPLTVNILIYKSDTLEEIRMTKFEDKQANFKIESVDITEDIYNVIKCETTLSILNATLYDYNKIKNNKYLKSKKTLIGEILEESGIEGDEILEESGIEDGEKFFNCEYIRIGGKATFLIVYYNPQIN